MNNRTLKLNIAQLSKTINKSRYNKYSDFRKENYQFELNKLFDFISKENFENLSESQLLQKKLVIDFIFESIEYLDNSTLTSMPFEIVFCIEKVLNEWIPSNKFIVCTSLHNNLLSYSITPKLALNEAIYELIKNQYGIEFSNRLIQINLPRYYLHDYLANVVLFHELGHFIDYTYHVSESLIRNKIFTGILNKNDPSLLKLFNHKTEFFADIFAAQYIGHASNTFLNHIAYKQPDSLTHPSTDSRIQKVNSFLVGNPESDIVEIIDWTLVKTNRKLMLRYSILEKTRFDELVPFEVQNDIELNSIFLAGWNNWLSEPNNLAEKFGENMAYKIINNLIEKSISNYYITSNWSKYNVSN